jgi:hypothetical protein
MEPHGAPWDPSFTFSESELVDVLHFVSGLADGDMGADRGAWPKRARCCTPQELSRPTGNACAPLLLHTRAAAQREAVCRSTHACMHARTRRAGAASARVAALALHFRLRDA